jgi:hypothetical protein
VPGPVYCPRSSDRTRPGPSTLLVILRCLTPNEQRWIQQEYVPDHVVLRHLFHPFAVPVPFTIEQLLRVIIEHDFSSVQADLLREWSRESHRHVVTTSVQDSSASGNRWLDHEAAVTFHDIGTLSQALSVPAGHGIHARSLQPGACTFELLTRLSMRPRVRIVVVHVAPKPTRTFPIALSCLDLILLRSSQTFVVALPQSNRLFRIPVHIKRFTVCFFLKIR